MCVGMFFYLLQLSKHLCFTAEQILAELLPFNTATVRRHDAKTKVEQTRYDLHRVQFAVTVERESDDVARVLVPGYPASGIHGSLAELVEELIHKALLTAQHDALP